MIEKDVKYIKNFPGRRPWKLNKPLDTDVTFDSPIDSDIALKNFKHFHSMQDADFAQSIID